MVQLVLLTAVDFNTSSSHCGWICVMSLFYVCLSMNKHLQGQQMENLELMGCCQTLEKEQRVLICPQMCFN